MRTRISFRKSGSIITAAVFLVGGVLWIAIRHAKVEPPGISKTGTPATVREPAGLDAPGEMEEGRRPAGAESGTAVTSVHTESYKVACVHNLRMIGIASQLYLNDYGTFPLASDKTDQATNESSRPAHSGFDHLQVIFDARFLNKSDVVICPGSEDRPATRNTNGTFTLTSDSCSYLWTRKLLSNASPATAPLAACKKDCHPEGRNLLFASGEVKWVTEEEFEKSFRKHFTAD
ncbi:MAG: hypothetical protein O7H41_17580 [Planctomycetota bacterium]|nr:hypothetical protein [Planctomycetota bacterium]